MSLGLLGSLPCYFGGKQKLVKQIFAHVRPPDEAPTVADCFMGGGSVSLFAKARGYQVIANDIADRSAIIGRALLANDRTRLTDDDVRGIFVPHPGNDGFVERHFAPDFFVARHARLIDNMLARARAAHDSVRRDLLLLVALHFILRWRPYGDFHQPGLIQKLVDGDLEGVNEDTIKVKVAGLFRNPSIERLRAIVRDVNAGVFDGGRPCEMHQLDVLDFLDKVEGDTLYADPPYFGSNAYEKVYKVLDQILAGKMIEPEISRFNQRDAEAALVALLDRARNFPLWLLSFGGGKLDAARCREIVAKFRPAEIVPVRCRYHFGSAGGQRADDKEILIVGRKA